MNIKVTQENLSRAVNNVARIATSSRGSLPILSNILLKTVDGRLNLSATNLEIGITEVVGAKIIEEGTITVPARLFQEYVSSLPSGQSVSLELKESKLEVVCGDYTSSINGVASDDFPEIPTIDDDPVWKIGSGDLKKALSQVVFAASADDARPVLTGVLLHSVEGEVFLAATDSYRLSEKKVGKSKTEISLLIPASALSDLNKILGDQDQEVFIHGDGQQVLFKAGDVELVSRLIEGAYPDYRKLLPSKFDVSAELEKPELQGAAKLASLFARESAGSILVSVHSDTKAIAVQSAASQLGENSTSLGAKVTGDGEISLNSRFLLDALQALNGSEALFRMNGKLDPCVVSSPEDDSFLHVIMPLKS